MRHIMIASVFVSLLAAGCSGGSPATVRLPAAPSSVVRIDAQSALDSVIASEALGGYDVAAAGALSIGRLARAIESRKVQAAPTCTSDTEVTIVSTPPTESVTEQLFYDAACTQLEKTIVANVNLTTGAATGTETVYSTAGAVEEFDSSTETRSASGSSTVYTETISQAANVSSTPYATIGLTCTLPPTGATTCSFAASNNVSSQGLALGEALTISGSAPAGALSYTAATTTYTGAIGALSISAGSGSTWIVSGGSASGSATVSGTASFSTQDGLLTSSALSLNDSSNGLTLPLTNSGAGESGSLSTTLGTAATISVDENGNGSLTFANGAQEQIAGYFLL